MSDRLPSVTSQLPRDLRAFLDRVRETLSGTGKGRFVTLDELTSGGVVATDSYGNIRPAAPQAYGTPPPPGNVTASAAIQNILIEWDLPQYPGHNYAEVWRSETDNLGDAVLIGLNPGAIYVDSVGPSVTHYYWVRFVNLLGEAGPFNGVAGTSATTGSDVAYLLDTLTGQITETQLYNDLNSRIDLIDGPATLPGSVDARVKVVNDIAVVKNRTYVAATAPAAPTYTLVAGDLWVDSDDNNKLYRWNGTAWAEVTDSRIGALVADFQEEVTTRASADLAETRKREALYAGAFAGTGNNYKYFVQATEPVGTQIGDIWSWVDPATGTVTFKRFDGTVWVDSAATQRAATYKGSFVDAPTTDLVIGDLYRDIDDNVVYVYDGSTWVERAAAVPDVAAFIEVEQVARADAESALSEQITTLDAQVNDAVTGLPATRATLINDYSTTADMDTAIANSKTVLRAYADFGSKTFRQNLAPTKRGVDSDTTLDIPLQAGDVWIDTSDQNKLYQWDGAAWVYSPDQAITGSVTALGATLTNDYLTKVDTEGAIASSGSFLRAYADNTSAVFRQADEPTKRGVDSETLTDIPLRVGDTWVDTDDQNRFYQWDGTQWVYSPDGVVTGAIDDVDARVTTVETAKIGYCTIDGVASDDTNRADCEAAGGVWNQGLPISTAVKQVAVTDANGDTAVIEQAFTAQKDLNDQFKLQYTIKLDVNGNVTGYGLYNTGTSSSFIINADRFAVTTPQSSIPLRVNNTPYSAGQIVRIAGVDDKTLVCKASGTSGAPVPTPGALGSMLDDGSVRWQVASRVPFAVQAVPQTINGVAVPAGVYVDAAYILNATIQNAQIADLAVDNNKIADLAVSKLTAGSIAADQYIQSSNFVTGSQGFRLNANGSAEFSNITIRQDSATAGSIFGGAATGYSSGTGFFSGYDGEVYGWRVGVPGGARIQWTGAAVEIYNDSNQLTFASGGLSASQISGLGALATKDGVTTSEVSGLGALATQDAVSWDTQITNIPAFGDFAYLSTITDANISTYIAGAAIGTAYIANAAITEALIADLAVGSAKIATAAITSAKIGDAEVGTLKIAGNAVTVPVSAFTAGDYRNDQTRTWNVVQEISITTSGGRVYISSGGFKLIGTILIGDSDFPLYPQFRLRRGTTVLMQSADPAMSYSETPSAATHTYYMDVYTAYPATTTQMTGAGVSNRSLFAIETKR